MALEPGQRWITVENGEHVLINGNGTIAGGMGGKFNGMTMNEVAQNERPDSLSQSLANQKQSDPYAELRQRMDSLRGVKPAIAERYSRGEQAYLDEGGAEVNAAYRQGSLGGVPDHIRKSIDFINSRAKPLSEDLELYRRVNSEGFKDILRKGSIIQDSALVSTSLEKHGADTGFYQDDTVIKIKAPAGTPAYVTSNVAEGEVILPSGTTLKVEGATVGFVGKSFKNIVTASVVLKNSLSSD